MREAWLVAAMVFVAALLQSAIFSSLMILGGTPDLLLVTLLGISLLRGSVTGALAGFLGGLVLDVANLGTLGVTSLLLTLAGYWTGRYGETTGRDRAHAPFLAVAVLTVLVAVGGLLLHYMLGDGVSAHRVLVAALPPAVLLNLLIAWPVSRLCRALVGSPDSLERAREMELGV